MSWTPLERGTMPPALKNADGLNWQSVWLNDKYQVLVRFVQGHSSGWPPMAHLSIRTKDKSTEHDWREYQRIKNELCGTEAEGVELYPAETRLLDEANQFHLWVVHPKHGQIPVGSRTRFIGTPEEMAKAGGAQRAFASHHGAEGCTKQGQVWPESW